MRRQRVGNACLKCRELKAKCDGRQPVCSRCEGYGFDCTWSSGKRKKYSRFSTNNADNTLSERWRNSSPTPVVASSTDSGLMAYRQAIQSYESLIQNVRANLDPVHQAAVDLSLQDIRPLMPQDLSNRLRAPNPEANAQGSTTAAPSPTYVGKASDVHFINSVRQCVNGAGGQPGDDTPAQNYSQDHVSESFVTLRHPIYLPSQAEADQFVGVYLSTVHIAYPFLSRSAVLEALARFQARDIHQPEFRPWLAILNFIFAIGSYYTSFPNGKNANNRSHFQFYDQGLYYSRELGAECCIMSVSILLVQCFFLLAVCLTDRCWNTLGFAIRMGQSIGLHIESPPGSTPKTPWTTDRARWRRTWYSMYVLDRLLALQLGRPMAIHQEDFKVELPSRDDTSPFVSPDAEQQTIMGSEQPRKMDYFLEVIRFSHVLGSVIRTLYQPSQSDPPPDQMLQNASVLDRRLTDWKLCLPRHLRFDLGHTFERSICFKRQRNMLAVKFHNLRALIHRPFLCLPMLQMNNTSFIDVLLRDKERITEAEEICVSEAQQTARLLYNVPDEQSLVHDFPWWQMISCLICASSILFVADSFHSGINRHQTRSGSAHTLREDAETCLKVFEALSVNSAAAQKATIMLEGLSRMRRSTDEGSAPAQQSLVPSGNEATLTDTQDSFNFYPPLSSPQLAADISSLWDWPSEISRSMEWSARFLDCSQSQPPGPSLPTEGPL